MKISCRTLAELERVYSIATIPDSSVDGLPAFLAGSEGDGALLLFEPPAYAPRIIADQPGGFMSLWSLIRDGRRYVVASVDFKPSFQAENCRILVLPLDEGECPPPAEVARIPYTHRIALANAGGNVCFLASTLCAAKAFKDDWSHPGGISMAVVPAEVRQPWRIHQIVSGLSKNHGMDFARLAPGGAGGFLLSAMEGLFYLSIPDDPAADWPCERICEGEHGDAFAFDWRGQGRPDIFTLSPFHGNRLAMLERSDGQWRRHVIADDLEMSHIVWAGDFLGRPGLLAGGRRGRKELRLYRPSSDAPHEWTCEILAEGIGATQIAVVNRGDAATTTLIVAAHARNEVLLYDIQ